LSEGNNQSSSVDIEMTESFPELEGKSVNELNGKLHEIELKLKLNAETITNENEKSEKIKRENERRQHNYIPLIFEMLKILAEKEALGPICEDLKEEEEKKIKEEEEKGKSK